MIRRDIRSEGNRTRRRNEITQGRCIFSMRFPYPVEAILFFTGACSLALKVLQAEIVYQFVSEKYNYTTNHSVKYCTVNQSTSEKDQLIAEEVSRWTKYITTALYVPSAIFSLVITALSDRIGRKWAILFPVIGFIITAAIQAAVYVYRLPLYILVLNQALNGSLGASGAILNIAAAYLSDTTPTKDRDKRFVILEVCGSVGAGGILIATGYWVKAYGFVPPSIFIIGCAVAALCFIPSMSPQKINSLTTLSRSDRDYTENDYLLPKTPSADAENSTALDDAKVYPVLHSHSNNLWKEVWRIYTTEYSVCNICDSENTSCSHGGGRHKGRIWRLWFFVFSYSLYMMAINGESSFKTMFLVSYPVCFTPDLVGIQNGLDVGLDIVSPLVVICYDKIMKFKRQTIILTGIFARMSFMFIIAFAEGPALVFTATSLGIFYNFTTAIIRSQISLLVSASEQGSALAVLTGMENIINIFAPIAFCTIYPATLYIFHGFAWIVASLILCIPFTMMLVIWFANQRREAYSIVEES